MKRFHLIGQNIQTSLSPLIHNFLFKLKGLCSKCHIYSLYHQENTLLSLDEMRKNDISGISITIPFKQSYAQDIKEGRMKNGFFMTEDDLKGKMQVSGKISAQEILSKRKIINTIKLRGNLVEKEYEFSGLNTDIFGVKMCFRQNSFFQCFLSQEKHRKGSLAIVIGGGATSEVFMSYFQELDIKMIVFNRSINKITGLKNLFYSNIMRVEGFESNQNLEGCNNLAEMESYDQVILINTLPTKILSQSLLENKGQTQCLLSRIFKKLRLERIHYMDVNYRDKEQTLLHVIRKSLPINFKQYKIHQISSGLDMLIWQAILQNHIFCTDSIHDQNLLAKQKLLQFLNQSSQIKKLISAKSQSI